MLRQEHCFMQKPQPREVSSFDNQLCCPPALQLYLFHIFNSINLLPFLVYVLTKIKNFVGKHTNIVKERSLISIYYLQKTETKTKKKQKKTAFSKIVLVGNRKLIFQCLAGILTISNN